MGMFRKSFPTNGITGIVIGRFNPLGEAEIAQIQSVLNDCQRVMVMVRDSQENPPGSLTFHERAYRIREQFKDTRRVMIMQLYDFGNKMQLYCSRNGTLERIILDDDAEPGREEGQEAAEAGAAAAGIQEAGAGATGEDKTSE